MTLAHGFRSLAWLTSAALLVACGDDSPTPADGSSTSTSDSSSTGGTNPGTTTGTTDGTADDTTSSGGSSSGDPTTSSSSGGSSDESSSSTGAPNFADPRGYTLVAPLGSRYTHLIDADGLEINRWESETTPANAAYLTPEGHLLRVARDPNPTVEIVSGAGGVVQEYDWDGNLVWQYDHVGPNIVGHHDIERLPNGNILIVAYEMFSVADAVAAGRDPADVSPDGLWADYLIEVDPTTDQIVWEWHVWDHLVQDYDLMANNYGVVGDSPELIDINWVRPGNSPRPDWTHINAVAYNAQYDQIVLSPRTFSEIWIIDHSTTTAEAASHAGGNLGHGGDLVYRWGNPATYDAGGEPERELYFQHNPRWLPDDKPGAGHILIFDNGDDTLRPWSRVLEIDTPVQPDGSYPMMGALFDPLDPIVVYEEPMSFYAAFVSGADRLSDGTTVVCSGPSGHIFEVDPMGAVGWEYSVPAQLFRAERYEADYPAWIGLSEEDLAPGDPLMVILEK